MEINYKEFASFDEIYKWFRENSQKEKEMFCMVKRGNPLNTNGILSYYDAVNAALCFGWIDSKLKNINGKLVQRFSPRTKKSHWTDLNVQRCIELYKKGLMSEQGIKACPFDFKTL